MGPYRVLRKLGEGGMGAVYQVQHLETGADYALKTISGQDPELTLRFQREVEAQARVDQHPHVVRIHAAGNHEGRLYFVMDLAAGGDLAARLHAQALDPEQAARLVRDLARGMAHVHAHGILHRDLKPQNVLFDAAGTPKLVDFGLAKVAGTDSLTQTGEILGTPVCMAPEQAKGLRDQIDERCDVYGLGALLHAALTREPLFTGRNPMEVLLHVCNTPPTPPSRLAPVPRALDAIVLRCLEKEPRDRFASATELADALDAWLGGAPARPFPAMTTVLALGAVGAVAIALGAVWLTRGRAPAPVTSDLGSPVAATPSTPAVAPVPVATATPSAPEAAPLTAEQRFAAFLAEVGEPDPSPPADVPAEIRAFWTTGIEHAMAAPIAAQQLRAAGFVSYSRQLALYGSGANPQGWMELGRSLLDENQPDHDLELARRCFRAAAEGNLSAGSRKLGVLSKDAYQAQGELSDLRDAARWFRDGLTRLPDDEHSRSECAAWLGRLALDEPEGGAELVSLDEAIHALREYARHPFAWITLAAALRKAQREDDLEEVVLLYTRAFQDDVGAQGDDACVELAHVLRDGWGALSPDPQAAFALLRDRLDTVEKRTEDPGWNWAPPLRLRYELADDFAGHTGVVDPPAPRRAADLWDAIVRLDEHRSWLYWASHWHLRSLATTSEDPQIQAWAERARLELERGSRAGIKDAVYFHHRAAE